MTERLLLNRTNHAGFGHEDEVTGEHLVATVRGSTLVVRIHDGNGQLTGVMTYTRVNWVKWTPSPGEVVADAVVAGRAASDA
jgi:hypothetical protein